MNLCTRCRQGLHEECKSKRRDLTEPADKGIAEMKQILQAQAMLLRGLMLTPGSMAGYPAVLLLPCRISQTRSQKCRMKTRSR
jgi:hypothetical protein